MTAPLYLSKSDFKVAQTCPTKLFYKKSGYPTTTEDNPYMKFLADGGFIIGKMAQLYYPDGIEITAESTAAALEETRRHLNKENVTLFEAALEHEGKLARVDILVKRGNAFEVIEVKATSAASEDDDEDETAENIFRGKKGGIITKWVEKLEDVTFQVMLLQGSLPTATIRPYVMLLDKNKTTLIDGIANGFHLTTDPHEAGSTFRKVTVTFSGDAAELCKSENRILRLFDVSREVDELLPEVRRQALIYTESLKSGLQKLTKSPNVGCKDCEYRASKEDERDGFRECLGKLADASPHIFELYYGSTIGGKKEPMVNMLLAEGKACLFDMPLEKLTKERGERQRIQIEHTRASTEYFEGLEKLISNPVYPLHFIDFETSMLAVPYHRGMAPYEAVAFQWSCHTIHKQGDEPIHSEWINVKDAFPNFEFAETLMEQIGTDGTVFMWATHENTILKTIHRQMSKYQHNNPTLKAWLEDIVKFDRKDAATRLTDMNVLTLKHYFHPMMKGKTSLKWVLPAVWTNERLHDVDWLKKYVKKENGKMLNPYDTLPKLEIAEKAEIIKEGTGAMRAYQELLYGQRRGDAATREQWKRLLLQYCELDTMAMVMVWLHWNMILKQR